MLLQTLVEPLCDSGRMDSSTPPNVDREKLAKLERMAAGVRTGGKGSVRRKKKAVHKAAPTDEKRLQSTLKRLQLNQLPDIVEVNIIRENGNVIHFKNPKVQAQIAANTYVVSGTAETKPLNEMMSSVLGSLPSGAGGSEMAQVQAMMEQLQASGRMPPGMDIPGVTQGKSATNGGETAAGNADDDDDDVPDLVDDVNFEATANAASKDEKDGEEAA